MQKETTLTHSHTNRKSQITSSFHTLTQQVKLKRKKLFLKMAPNSARRQSKLGRKEISATSKKNQENRKTPHRKSKEKSKKHIVEGCQREKDNKKSFFLQKIKKAASRNLFQLKFLSSAKFYH